MNYNYSIPESPEILTTTVGSYSPIDWLAALPSEQSLIDATRVVFDVQRKAGIDLPTDGELYRFDINHPDTNGMIDYFTGKIDGIRSRVGRTDWIEFNKKESMKYRLKPSGVVEDELSEGELNLYEDCLRAALIVQGPFKFTLTSPYMLARTLLDRHYGSFHELVYAIAGVMAKQVTDLPCACVQVDEANIPGNPEDSRLAAEAINIILDNVKVERAVHLCFGNYGGQSIQKGVMDAMTGFLNSLNVDHLVLELARKTDPEIAALKEIDENIALGVGVIDIKVNHIETPDEIAKRIEKAVNMTGQGRVKWVHPDCGFWMLKRSIAERKITALVKGRDRFLGR